MSVENGKVCCNCRHCKRIQKEPGSVIECHCDLDNAYLTIETVLTYWCRHWAKERPMCGAKDEAICEEMTEDGHCNYSKPCPNKEVMVEEDGLLVPGCIIDISDNNAKGCRSCKHCSKLITEEPCMDCDPRTDSPKNHWEAEG